jgi:riboflavin biosynthesis pyrimidine reductase
VRSNFITSLDGGATLDGVSGGLAGPATGRCSVLRELADVIVVGAGTVRMENYGGAVLSAAARPPAATAVSRSCRRSRSSRQSGRLDRT